jgi:hypothetical protein
MPLRRISEGIIAINTEPSVNSPYPSPPRIIKPLHSPYPQINVGIGRIFHQYRHIATFFFNTISDFLHSKWIDRGSGTNP